MCELFGVDLAYTAEHGGSFVTDSSAVLLNLICTHRIDMCKECVVVVGPEDANVTTMQRLHHAVHGYAIGIEWENDYLGPVQVDLDTARCAMLYRTTMPRLQQTDFGCTEICNIRPQYLTSSHAPVYARCCCTMIQKHDGAGRSAHANTLCWPVVDHTRQDKSWLQCRASACTAPRKPRTRRRS